MKLVGADWMCVRLNEKENRFVFCRIDRISQSFPKLGDCYRRLFDLYIYDRFLLFRSRVRFNKRGNVQQVSSISIGYKHKFSLNK